MSKGDPYYEFNPFKETGISVPKESRAAALEECATYIKEKILANCGDGKTSVQGGLWKRKLSDGYAKIKKEESSSVFANLELHGDLLDSLDTFIKGQNKVVVAITDDSQLDKAEGNLLGSYGRTENPDNAREFMPHKRGQKLSEEIMEGVREILEGYSDGE